MRGLAPFQDMDFGSLFRIIGQAPECRQGCGHPGFQLFQSRHHFLLLFFQIVDQVLAGLIPFAGQFLFDLGDKSRLVCCTLI